MTSNNNNNNQQLPQNNMNPIVQQLAMQQMNNMNPILKDYKNFQQPQNVQNVPNVQNDNSSNGEPSDLDNTNLYIKGLWKDCTQVELDDLFKQFGVISQSRVYGDGVGFVRFEQGFEAKAAIDSMDKCKLDRCQDVLLVKYAFKKQRNSKRYVREVEMIMNKNTNNVYLRCLPRGFNEKQLTELCSPYGELTCTRLRESGVAFVRFRKPDDAQKAIRALNGQRFDGHNETLLAKLANSDPFQPKIGFKSGQQNNGHQHQQQRRQQTQSFENGIDDDMSTTNTMTPSQQSQPQLINHNHMSIQQPQHALLNGQQQQPQHASYMIPQYTSTGHQQQQQQYTHPHPHIIHQQTHHYQQQTQYPMPYQAPPQQTHYYDTRYYQPQVQTHMQPVRNVVLNAQPQPQPYPHNYTDPSNGYNPHHYIHTQYPPQPYPPQPHGPPPQYQHQPYQPQPQQYVLQQPTPINTKIGPPPQQISPSTVPSNTNTVTTNTIPSTIPPVPSTNTPTSVIIDTPQGQQQTVVINTQTPSKQPLITAPSYMPTNTNNNIQNNGHKVVEIKNNNGHKLPIKPPSAKPSAPAVFIPTQVYYPGAGIGSPPVSELSFQAHNVNTHGGGGGSVGNSSIAHAVDGIISMVAPNVAPVSIIPITPEKTGPTTINAATSPGYINGNVNIHNHAWRSAAANIGNVPVVVPMQNLTIISEPKVEKNDNNNNNNHNKENISELNRDSSNPHGVSRISANQLHEVITVWYPDQAGKLTGMFLQNHDQEKVTKYLNRPERLKKKIGTFAKLLSTKTQVQVTK